MKVFAVSDLHLPGNQNKPMDVFGGNWTGHLEKIKSDWAEKVSQDDIVLLAGDTSWAMVLDDALSDLRKLAGLPGKKVFIRGNHDYWWSGINGFAQERSGRNLFLFAERLRPFRRTRRLRFPRLDMPGLRRFCRGRQKDIRAGGGALSSGLSKRGKTAPSRRRSDRNDPLSALQCQEGKFSLYGYL